MPKGKASDPDKIDKHVGARLHARRRVLQVSQSNLAHAMGVTFQQIQKYEGGYNRIAASRLYEAAKALNVEVSYFFEGLPSTLDGAEAAADPMKDTRLLGVLGRFVRLLPTQRKAVEDMIDALRERA